MTLRFYSNETEDATLLAEIEDIDDKFGCRIERILLSNLDTSIPYEVGEPALIKYGGIGEVRIICNNVFVANTHYDQVMTTKFFREAFFFDFNEDLEKWIPQIKRVVDALDKIPVGPYSYWYMST